MLIFLVGFMGSGKTFIGKQLASRLNYRFIDIDHEIKEKFKLSVAEIFEKYGEEKFRHSENELIVNLNKDENIVVSTGGGLPCFFNNMELMNRFGMTIYLKTTIKTLVNRLKGSQNSRPMIQGLTNEELPGYVNDKLREREPFYLKSKIIIDSDALIVEDLINILAST